MTYQFKAFISYSHSDKIWAEWLQQELETYEIPPKLSLDASFPWHADQLKTFHPVFRDETELPACDSLPKEIEKCLDHSFTLIVLCSSSSMNSRWVKKEICYFQENCSDRRIIPVVLPDLLDKSKIPEETVDLWFNPLELLCDNADSGSLEMPLAAKFPYSSLPDDPVIKDELYNEVLKIIAGILNVNLGELKERDKIYIRHRQALQSLPRIQKVREIILDERNGYFISYCSKNNSIKENTEKLKRYFKRRKIPFCIDNAHLKENQSITKFIERISTSKYIVIFISDDYFKSWWCMKECVKTLQTQIDKENIFCIMTADFQTNLEMPSKKETLISYYCNYWEIERNARMEAKSKRGNSILEYEDEDMEDNTLKSIIHNIPKFINYVFDTLCCDSVEQFIKAVKIKGKNANLVDLDPGRGKDPVTIEMISKAALINFETLSGGSHERRDEELIESFLRGAAYVVEALKNK